MTGRSDFGSRAWLHPALLSDAPSDTLRRGAQQDILRALRRLLVPHDGESARPVVRPAQQREDRLLHQCGGDTRTQQASAAHEHQPSRVALGRRLVAARWLRG